MAALATQQKWHNGPKPPPFNPAYHVYVECGVEADVLRLSQREVAFDFATHANELACKQHGEAEGVCVAGTKK